MEFVLVTQVVQVHNSLPPQRLSGGMKPERDYMDLM